MLGTPVGVAFLVHCPKFPAANSLGRKTLGNVLVSVLSYLTPVSLSGIRPSCYLAFYYRYPAPVLLIFDIHRVAESIFVGL